MEKDMTVGSPAKLIFSFSIPLLIGNIFQQFYNMVDTIIVGRFVGQGALASVGATGSMNFLILGFVLGLTSGFSVLAAQHFGAKDEDKLRHSVAMSAYLCIIVTIVITAFALLITKPLLTLMHTPSDIYDGANTYISIIFWGIGAIMLYNMVSGILRALGDSKTPLYFLVFSSILNVILDLFFVINLHMGVAGAAWATVISQGVAGILCVIYMLKKYPVLKFQKKDWVFKPKTAKKLMVIGLPMSLQFSITAIGALILQGAINKLGSDVVAAYTAASKVENLVGQPLATLGVTIATYAGQNLGAGHYSRIQEGVKKSIEFSVFFCILGALLIYVFGKQFIYLFLPECTPDVMAYAIQYLNTIAIFLIFLGLLFIYRNALQGMGYALIPMLAGVGELVMRSVVAIVFSVPFGYDAIVFAGPCAWIAAELLLMVTYHIKMKRQIIPG